MWVSDKEMPLSYFSEDYETWERFPEETLEKRCLKERNAVQRLQGLLSDANAEYKASWASVSALFKMKISLRRSPAEWAERLTRYADARETYKDLVRLYRIAMKSWKLTRSELSRRNRVRLDGGEGL